MVAGVEEILKKTLLHCDENENTFVLF